MKTCLLTGATGLIGSILIRKLLEEKWNVYALVRDWRKKRNLVMSNQCYYIDCDLSTCFESCSFPSQIDSIIHLAQENDFRDFPRTAEKIFNVNIVSTMRLLEYGRRIGVKRFVFASSGGIYEAGYGEINEDGCIFPDKNLGFYLGSKLCSEILSQNYSDFMNIIRCRFFFVYGRGQKETMLIPRLVNSVINEKPVYLEGENGLYINPINVNDAVSAILSTLTLECSDVFNVAGPNVLSLRDIAIIIGEKVGKRPIFEVNSKIKEKCLVADISKMKEKLFMPMITFQEGIKELC